MTLRVLVVEDDAEIRELLRAALAAEGFDVATAVSVSEATALVEHAPPDAIMLDLGLPDGDGASLVRAVRSRSAVPIVIASARHDEAGKIALLDAGADDYLVKPFAVGELLARLRVALRHRGSTLQPALRRIERDGLLVDLDERKVTRDGATVHLTPTEFALLRELAINRGKLLTHAHLLRRVWGHGYETETEYVRVYVRRLRAKLEADNGAPIILTQPRAGYRIAADLSD